MRALDVIYGLPDVPNEISAVLMRSVSGWVGVWISWAIEQTILTVLVWIGDNHNYSCNFMLAFNGSTAILLAWNLFSVISMCYFAWPTSDKIQWIWERKWIWTAKGSHWPGFKCCPYLSAMIFEVIWKREKSDADDRIVHKKWLLWPPPLTRGICWSLFFFALTIKARICQVIVFVNNYCLRNEI